jgi:hypothetical protein
MQSKDSGLWACDKIFTAMKIHIMTVWIMVPSSLIEEEHTVSILSLFLDAGSWFAWNIATILPDYTVS